MTDFPEFARYAYLKKGEQEVSAHALRLAVGLESQLKGERQICVQLARWAREITSKPLGDIWVKALSSAQKIRAISGLGEDDVNIANLVLNDIKKRLGCKNNYKIIIIGTGKIAELFAQYSSREIYLDFAAHKNYSKATKLAGYSNGKALLFDDLPGAIAGADALISATLSPHYIITRDRLSSWISGRSHPIYVYDLAVPRDVDPRVSGLEGVLLPDIRDILDRHNLSVEKKVLSATAMIEGALINHGEIVYEKTA
jgi:glutamyl-tRNA reductase